MSVIRAKGLETPRLYIFVAMAALGNPLPPDIQSASILLTLYELLKAEMLLFR